LCGESNSFVNELRNRGRAFLGLGEQAFSQVVSQCPAPFRLQERGIE